MTRMMLLIALPWVGLAQVGDGRSSGVTISRSFKTAAAGAPVSVDFPLTNDGAGPLRIVDQRASCGCVALAASPMKIAPGAEARLRVSVDTSRLHGYVVQSVTLKTDHSDPNKRMVRLEVRGLVIGLWTEPLGVDFGTIMGDVPARREVDVFAAGLPGVRITSVEVVDPKCVRPVLHAVHLREDQRGLSVDSLGRIELIWAGGAKAPGFYKTDLIVHTSASRDRDLRLPITAHVSGLSKVTPSVILFGTVHPGQSVKRTCKIRLESGTDRNALREWKWRSDCPCLTCRLESVDEARGEACLTVTLEGLAVDSPRAPKAGLSKGCVSARWGDRVMLSVPYVMYFDREDQPHEPPRPR